MDAGIYKHVRCLRSLPDTRSESGGPVACSDSGGPDTRSESGDTARYITIRSVERSPAMADPVHGDAGSGIVHSPGRPVARVHASCSINMDTRDWEVGCSLDCLTTPVHRINEDDTDEIIIHIKYRRDASGRRICTMTTILEAVTGDTFSMTATTDPAVVSPTHVSGKGTGKGY